MSRNDDDELLEPIEKPKRKRRRDEDETDESPEAYLRGCYKVLVAILILICAQIAVGLVGLLIILTNLPKGSPF